MAKRSEPKVDKHRTALELFAKKYVLEMCVSVHKSLWRSEHLAVNGEAAAADARPDERGCRACGRAGSVHTCVGCTEMKACRHCTVCRAMRGAGGVPANVEITCLDWIGSAEIGQDMEEWNG